MSPMWEIAQKTGSRPPKMGGFTGMALILMVTPNNNIISPLPLQMCNKTRKCLNETKKIRELLKKITANFSIL